MSYDRNERIRRAAILISSLEESLAEQMLQTLPPREAEKVLAEVDRLGAIDAEEVEDVLQEFRTAGRRGRTSASTVEFTYSAPPAAAQIREQATNVAVNSAAAEAAAAQGDADAALTAELLANEHPQTIAAALSRLGHERGAAVFASLPASLQAEVLDRVANLEPADEDIVAELETQLQRRIDQHRQRRERAASAAELARRMLEKTAPAQRASLLARLSLADPTTATSAETMPAQEAVPVALQAQVLATAVRRAKSPAPAIESLLGQAAPAESWTDDPPPPGSTVAPPALEAVLDDGSIELESLSDRALLEALRLADERTVQRALAASSENFLNRVAGKLPRRQAARLRKLVRSLGPTRLAELREAQHELLRIAREEGSGVRGPLSVVRCDMDSNN